MANELTLIFTNKGKTDYLLYCLEQAKKSCPECRIVLLGDESNIIDDSKIEHYNISDYSDSANKFEKVYRHQSSNAYQFELFCFQRWFIIKDFVNKNNISTFCGCDTDIMIYSDLSKFIPSDKSKITIANKNGPQCSFFTKDSINAFCDYIMKQYTELKNIQRLLQRYKYFLDNNKSGGNCDMTMFELYEKDFPGSVLEYGFLKPNGNNLIYCCSCHYDWIITEKIKKLIIAKIKFINDVRVRRKKPHSANRKKPIFDKRKEPRLPESDLLFRVIQAVPLQERPLFF